MQNGPSSTFQLTLGGTFDAGPAWFRLAALEFPDVARKVDAEVIQGWATHDFR